jgi:hypothetical protein
MIRHALNNDLRRNAESRRKLPQTLDENRRRLRANGVWRMVDGRDLGLYKRDLAGKQDDEMANRTGSPAGYCECGDAVTSGPAMTCCRFSTANSGVGWPRTLGVGVQTRPCSEPRWSTGVSAAGGSGSSDMAHRARLFESRC